MSSFEQLDKYSMYSTLLIAEDPKVRASGVRKMMELYYQAPDLQFSITTKIEQSTKDSDETVVKLATQMLNMIQSGKQYNPYYSPTQPASPSTTAPSTPRPAQNAKNIVANVICCIIFIVIYIVIFYVM